MDDENRARESRNPRAVRGGGRSKSFKRVNYVLNNVMSKLGLDRRLREHTLMNLWPQLAGEPWASRSRPIFIDSEYKLVVAVSDASTGQELSLLKGEILRKLKAAGRAIGVDIAGLRFDLKHYYDAPEKSLDAGAYVKPLPEPTGEELSAVELTAEDLSELACLSEQLSVDAAAGNPVASERIMSVFERELRLRHWMRKSGFPVCSSCNNPARALLTANRVCAVCYWGGK